MKGKNLRNRHKAEKKKSYRTDEKLAAIRKEASNMRHHLYNPDFKFVVEPEHFNKYTEDYLLLNAAHERTDIDITEEMKMSDEELLNE